MALGRPADAVRIPIDQGRTVTRGKTAPAACLTLASIFGASDEDAFVALANRPNHHFSHPRIFAKADGLKTMRSKMLAWA
jgi:hypothetical protein